MGTFACKPEYSVSVSILDTQHKRLFTLAQALQDAMSAERDRDVLTRCLGELIDYAKIHTLEEESLLINYDYADLVQHRFEHLQLVNNISDFQQQFTSGKGSLTAEFLDIIKNSMINHILQIDMRYADFFNKLGVY